MVHNASLKFADTLQKCGAHNISVMMCEIENLGGKKHIGET